MRCRIRGSWRSLAKHATKPGFWQSFNEYYVNGLLWGPKTWMANFLGNTGMTLWAIPERALGGADGRDGDRRPGRGSQRDDGELDDRHHQGLGSRVHGVQGRRVAVRKGVRHGSDGSMPTRSSARARRSVPRHFELVGPAGQAVDAIGNFIRFPMRVLVQHRRLLQGHRVPDGTGRCRLIARRSRTSRRRASRPRRTTPPRSMPRRPASWPIPRCR